MAWKKKKLDIRAFFRVFYVSINTLVKKEVLIMPRLAILQKRKAALQEEIVAHLDSFLIGTVAKSPSMSGYNLTTKVEGKTVTLYVRKNLVPVAIEMSKRYKHLWILIQKLSKINWEILKLEQP
ncbi:MAG: hypothetical protein C0407_12245 [Desulfobacca sp.]|nr:hypothetical protein [Desulfobacca sp.]